MGYEGLEKEILTRVGGIENISTMTHCATRLRFTLNNRAIVDKEALEKNEGIISIIEASGQFQIVIGTYVDKVYRALEEIKDKKGGDGC